MSDPVPTHRRHDDTKDMQGHRIQNAVDSTWLKVFARMVLPIAMTVIGFFLVRTLVNVEEGQRRSAIATAEQGRDLSQVKSDVRNITTRLDEGVVREVKNNGTRLEDHEKRIQVLERTVRVP